MSKIPTDDQRTRIEQSNYVADIVFAEVKKVWPDLHPVLDLRYGIADALWAAGFRRFGDTYHILKNTKDDR